MLRIASASLVSLLVAGPALSQGLTRPKDAQITAHDVVTAPMPMSDERTAGLKLPQGFPIARWAEGLDTPRVIAVARNGDVYVSSPPKGTLALLLGTDKATPRTTVREKKNLHGFLGPTGAKTWTRFARPFGLAVAKDGSLLMGEDQSGVIYRITYSGK